MSPAKQQGNNFQYWFDISIKGAMTIMLVVFAFFGERMINQDDEYQKEINGLKVQVATLETKIDFIIRHMDYSQNTRTSFRTASK